MTKQKFIMRTITMFLISLLIAVPVTQWMLQFENPDPYVLQPSDENIITAMVIAVIGFNIIAFVKRWYYSRKVIYDLPEEHKGAEMTDYTLFTE